MRFDFRGLPSLRVESLLGSQKALQFGSGTRCGAVATGIVRPYGSSTANDFPSQGMVRVRADHLQGLVGVLDRIAGRAPTNPVVCSARRRRVHGISIRAVVRPLRRSGDRGHVPQVQAQRSQGSPV